MVGWSSRVIEELVALKRAGVSFRGAWEMAVTKHPPGERDLGPRVQRLIPDEGQPPSLVEFTKQVCDDAWHGRRAVLRHMGQMLDILDGLEEAEAERKALGGRHSRDRLVA